MGGKQIIYQVLPRLFGNTSQVNKENGTIEENGVGKFSAFTAKALSEIKKLGVTHIWYTGVIEHASKTDYTANGIPKDNPDVVKGNAGSPYAIRDYYDVSPDLADKVENRREEFQKLVDRTHKSGLKVIIDFVPNHVARQYRPDAQPAKVKALGVGDDLSKGFFPDNNFYYLPNQALSLQFEHENGYEENPAKVTGNDRFDANPTAYDWYETVKLNYGVDYLDGRHKYFTPVPDTWYKMLDILQYWASKGVDGFRCDMVEMVPVEFWNWVIPRVKAKHKGVEFIGEVYNPDEYANYVNAGLDYLYDKVGLYDTLKDVICERKPASDITFCWQKLGDMQPKMLNFLENHDEQRIASDFFAVDPHKAIPGMLISATMNNNPVMIYAGQELGERGMDREGFSGIDGRTTIFDYWSVTSLRDWYNDGAFGNKNLDESQLSLRQFYGKLLNLCNQEEAIVKGSFYDLMYANYENEQFDPTKQFAYLRVFKKEVLLIVANFSDEAVQINVNIPEEAVSFLKINFGQYKSCKELLTGKQRKLKKIVETNFETDIDAHSGKIFKFIAE